MAAEEEDFNSIGPTHLTAVDWDNDNHRRSVAAALVGGVYIIERDRQEKRQGQEALAPLWWEFFHFRLVRPLVDDVDNSIFGAIFEYELENSPVINNSSKNGIPHYIVAIRGTIIKPDSRTRDLQLNFQVIQNELHKTSRLEIALRAVRDTVAGAQNMNVWLTGHSLGAAIALLVGKNMALAGNHLETYLFNPPFISALMQIAKDEILKPRLPVFGSVVAAGLASAMSLKITQERATSGSSSDSFAALATWVPNLFVHPSDFVCSEYIDYFTHRQKFGVGKIVELAFQYLTGRLAMNVLGEGPEPGAHLIPSACLSVNRSHAKDFKEAHGLKQWWKPDLQLHTDVHLYT